MATLVRPRAGPGPLDNYWYQPVGQDTPAGIRVTPDAALKQSVAWACGRLLAEVVASLPLITYRQVDDDTRERAADLPLYDVLHDEPNSWQTSLEWRDLLQMQMLFRGNGYCEIKPGPRGPVDQLVPLSPDSITPEAIPGGLRYRQRLDSGGERILNAEDVFHLRGLSLDGITGVSVIQYARDSIGFAIAAEQYGARLFSQDARPGGVLSYPDKLTPEGKDRLKADWNAAHQGLGGAHHTALLQQGVTWTQVGMTNEDAQFLATRQFQLEEIARWFRVPLHLIGSMTKETSWGSGIEQLSLGFVIYTILPICRRWEGSIRRDLILDRGRFFTEFLLSGLLRGDQKTRYESYAIARQWGWLCVNDIRRLENQNPIPGGGRYLEPLNMQNVNAPTAPGIPAQPRGIVPENPAQQAHYQMLVHDAASRVIRREIVALGKAAKRCASDAAGWHAAVDEFYQDHAAYVTEALKVHRPAAESYVGQQKAVLLRDGALAMLDWESRRTLDLVALALEEHHAGGTS